MNTMDCRGLRRSVLGIIFLLLSSSTHCYPRRTYMTDHCKNDGTSRGYIPQHLETSRNDVPELLYDNHDEYAGRTIVSMTFCHELLQHHTLSDFPNFFQQPFTSHYGATYESSQSRRTVVSSVGFHFCNFCSNPLYSPLDRFPAKQRET